jgi:hypothetical protein
MMSTGIATDISPKVEIRVEGFQKEINDNKLLRGS